jgi:hypothetical protein
MENVLKVLTRLVRERRALQAKERRHAQRERQMIDSLRELLPRMGYRVVPASGAPARIGATGPRVLKPKRLQCPRCERRFAHPLPMARHLRATHGVNPVAQTRKSAGKGKSKLKKSA